MVQINSALINNVDEKSLLKFLAEENCIKSASEEMGTLQWINLLLTENKINVKKLNKFFFDELFYGMHRYINIYKISSCRKAQYVDDWIQGICSDYDIDKIDYNRIVDMYTTRDDGDKIIAIEATYDDTKKLEKLKMLFFKQITINEKNGQATAYSYIPVSIDFKKKLIVVKARQRQNIGDEKHKRKYLMEQIFCKVVDRMEIDILPFNEKHQEALYRMSKGLLEELFSKIPAFNVIQQMHDPIDTFLRATVENLPLDNLVKDDMGNRNVKKGVLDMKDELNKLLQQLILSDYFFNRDEENIWDIGISAIITCIRFNDNKNATARLNGENRTKQIFNSKSFLGLRNSIEAVKIVESISIAFKKNNSVINVKYNATEEDYLSVLVLSYKPYHEDDFEKIWEIYKHYESATIEQTTELRRANLN